MVIGVRDKCTITDSNMNFKTNNMIQLREDALITLLRKDFKAHKMCASDTTHWILKDPKQVEQYFHKWLKNEGYSD